MKKWFKGLALVLALTMLLSTAALAAGDNGKATITDQVTGATATFDTSNPDIINVTFTSSQLTAGSQYLVLMVKGGENDYEITESTILYIDQTAAVGNEDGTATVTFQVYPSSIQNSVILITGVDGGPLVAAIVEAKYILGDVDGSGNIDVGDATMLLRYLAGLAQEGQVDLQAANVDGSADVDVGDATLLLRVLANLATLQ